MPYSAQQLEGVKFKGKALVVFAGAGTGKTFLLKGFAKENPEKRMLYICYNSSIQKEAKEKFKDCPNVMCRTLHSIAYSRYGNLIKHKLVDNIRLFTIKEEFSLGSNWALARDINTAFNKFLISNDPKLSLENLSFLPSVTSSQKKYINKVAKYAQKMWLLSKDPKSNFPATHDVYLKMYSLDPPELHKWFSYLLFDEAQDANPVAFGLVSRQLSNKVLVGDEHQQLYRWRGADNAIRKFIETESAKVIRITMSFRFGEKIGKLATSLLDYKSRRTQSKPFPLEGNPKVDDQIATYLPSAVLKEHHARLHRTVMGTLKTALKFIDKKIFWVGGIEKYNLQNLLDVYHLKTNQKDKVKNKKLLVDYRNYNDYKTAAKSVGDFEMLRTIKIIEEHQNSIPAKIAKLKKNAVSVETESNLTVSTVHGSKGLEWDVVVVDDDFRDLLDSDINFSNEEVQDEMNLLYVAATRAMKKLQINNLILGILKNINKEKVPDYINIADTKTALKSKPLPRRRTHQPNTPPQKIRLGD